MAPARPSGLIRRYVAGTHATLPPADTGAKQFARDPSPNGQEALLVALRAAVSGHPPPPEARHTRR
ncbi:hypothetical protein Z045_25860 [Rhodococcus pyridinivorans KG-16]|uniref:Uncharacterized protein n=1 Tax=Rhodococcus pyridinivorans KG-16 TaxID=1441730 RepID=A0A0V9UDG7_9NOCA|nr:hypothetical protein [Rhodococcus pyridinivorans]KSZ55971.1 hypothetical protein Z045_25860 [Rhodococcus pyridinivorans KG-16]